jgi:predicted ATPase/DNA-binding SARP family transcriptional activator
VGGLRVGMLGPLEVASAAGPVEIGAPKQRALLVLLALRAGRVVAVEELIGGLWGDEPPRTAVKTLQTYVSGLRRALPDGAVSSAPGGYGLVIEPEAVDAGAFEDLIGSARHCRLDGDVGGAVQRLRSALGLWRGPALLGASDAPAAMAAAQRLEELRREAVEDLAELGLTGGDHRALIADLEAAVNSEPLRERRWAQLMMALYRSGRQADALRAYQRLRHVLGDELGIEPSAELANLEKAILLQQPDLDWPQTESASRTSMSTRSTSSTPGLATRPDNGATVTFLLGELEGATSQWEDRPEAMATASACLLQIFTAGIESRQGTPFTVAPDQVGAMFRSASECAEVAVAIQRQLLAGVSDTRARFVLHTGPLDETQGRPHSGPLNRATRILSAAYGGQIVASRITAELVHDRATTGFAIRDLGEHRLRDLHRPERVYQIQAEGLPNDFPTLQSLDNPRLRHNLPIQATSFVGRDHELREVVSLIGVSRLVTLTGPGGVGKTRLAVQAASELIDGSGDGVWLVELAPVSSPDLVDAAVLKALGLPEDAGRPFVDTLLDALRTRRLLIVLDNCEHVMNACVTLADLILRTCQDVHLLATSREPLGVGGERVYRVPSLSLPPVGNLVVAETVTNFEAVRLFIDRAVHNQSDFIVDDTNAAIVVSVCRRVDGIPLAIELAAARLRSMSLTTIEARLNDRFRLLTGGNRAALARQQTLLALIDWSYDLLNERERVVFRRLSVFVAGFDLDAAELVCARGDLHNYDVVEMVTSLVEKSLVQMDELRQGSRYRLLESIRQYAAERLMRVDPEDARDTLEAHADAYLLLAEEAAPYLEGPQQLECIQRLELERDNVRAAGTYLVSCPERGLDALRLIVALSRYILVRPNYRQDLALIDSVLGHEGAQEPSEDRIVVMFLRAKVLSETRGLVDAQQSLVETAAMARDIAQPALLGEILAMLSIIGALIDNSASSLETAIAEMEEAVSVSVRSCSGNAIARALRCRGDLRGLSGDAEGAISDLSDSVSKFRSEGNNCQAARSLNNLANWELLLGAWASAKVHLEEALGIASEMALVSELPWIYNNLGLIAIHEGRWHDARPLLLNSLLRSRMVSSNLTVGVSAMLFAVTESATGKVRSAAVLHGAADEIIGDLHVDAVERRLRAEDLAHIQKLLDATEYQELREAGRRITTIEMLLEYLDQNSRM